MADVARHSLDDTAVHSDEEMTEGTPSGMAASGSPSKRTIKRWTEEEHDMLVKLVEQLGQDTCWATIAEHIPGRTGKQCRERYVNHIGDIKKGGWTAEEEAHMARLHAAMGPAWTRIAAALGSRTENSVKNHFNALLRSKRLDDKVTSVLARYVRIVRDKAATGMAAYDDAVRQATASAEAMGVPLTCSQPSSRLNKTASQQTSLCSAGEAKTTARQARSSLGVAGHGPSGLASVRLGRANSGSLGQSKASCLGTASQGTPRAPEGGSSTPRSGHVVLDGGAAGLAGGTGLLAGPRPFDHMAHLEAGGAIDGAIDPPATGRAFAGSSAAGGVSGSPRHAPLGLAALHSGGGTHGSPSSASAAVRPGSPAGSAGDEHAGGSPGRAQGRRNTRGTARSRLVGTGRAGSSAQDGGGAGDGSVAQPEDVGLSASERQQQLLAQLQQSLVGVAAQQGRGVAGLPQTSHASALLPGSQSSPWGPDGLAAMPSTMPDAAIVGRMSSTGLDLLLQESHGGALGVGRGLWDGLGPTGISHGGILSMPSTDVLGLGPLAPLPLSMSWAPDGAVAGGGPRAPRPPSNAAAAAAGGAGARAGADPGIMEVPERAELLFPEPVGASGSQSLALGAQELVGHSSYASVFGNQQGMELGSPPLSPLPNRSGGGASLAGALFSGILPSHASHDMFAAAAAAAAAGSNEPLLGRLSGLSLDAMIGSPQAGTLPGAGSALFLVPGGGRDSTTGGGAGLLSASQMSIALGALSASNGGALDFRFERLQSTLGGAAPTDWMGNLSSGGDALRLARSSLDDTSLGGGWMKPLAIRTTRRPSSGDAKLGADNKSLTSEGGQASLNALGDVFLAWTRESGHRPGGPSSAGGALVPLGLLGAGSMRFPTSGGGSLSLSSFGGLPEIEVPAPDVMGCLDIMFGEDPAPLPPAPAQPLAAAVQHTASAHPTPREVAPAAGAPQEGLSGGATGPASGPQPADPYPAGWAPQEGGNGHSKRSSTHIWGDAYSPGHSMAKRTALVGGAPDQPPATTMLQALHKRPPWAAPTHDAVTSVRCNSEPAMQSQYSADSSGTPHMPHVLSTHTSPAMPPAAPIKPSRASALSGLGPAGYAPGQRLGQGQPQEQGEGIRWSVPVQGRQEASDRAPTPQPQPSQHSKLMGSGGPAAPWRGSGGAHPLGM